MLNILPIKLVDSDEQAIYGVVSYKLAVLSRLNLEVTEGIVISPPDFILQTTLQHLKDAKTEVFEQRLELIKSQINKIPAPENLPQALGKNNWLFINGEIVENKKVWATLVSFWLSQIRSRIWRTGFTQGLNDSITPVVINFALQHSEKITAFIDSEQGDVVIKSSLKLTVPQVEYIKKFVKFADNKLFLPHEYLFLKSQKIQLASVKEYTQPVLGSTKQEVEIPKVVQKELIKSAIKIFIDASSGFANLEEFDGVLIKGEEVLTNYPGGNMENMIFKLESASISLPSKPVIFRLPDLIDKENIRGSLRLLYQKNLLNESLEAFKFLKNKKNIMNIHIGFPITRDPQELTKIKRELASHGINRKGMLTFWMEMGVPENIININEYIEVGIDGVILNLDLIHSCLGGYHTDEGEYYKHQIKTLFEFLKPAIKALHKHKIPVISTGALTLHPEVLDFLVEVGIWGVISNNVIEAQSLPEHLSLTEKRVLSKKTTTFA